jgi:hypothetical protein
VGAVAEVGGGGHRERSATALSHQANAAAHVEDAFFGEEDDSFKRPWLQKLFAQLNLPRRGVLLLYIGFSFVERPAWCYRAHSDHGGCTTPQGGPVCVCCLHSRQACGGGAMGAPRSDTLLCLCMQTAVPVAGAARACDGEHRAVLPALVHG